MGRRRQVDLVGADAEGTDRQKVGRRLDGAARDGGLGPDAEHLDAVESSDEVVLVEGTGVPDDLQAGGLEGGIGVGVRVFQK